MPCSINFLVALKTEILSTVTSDFLRQMIILKPFNFVFTIKVLKNWNTKNNYHNCPKLFGLSAVISPKDADRIETV